MKTAKDVLKSIKDNDVKYVDLRFTDPHGQGQHVSFDVGMIEEDTFAEGLMFDGSSIAGWKAINESDMCLMPDPVTATIDPFFAETTLVITCDVLEPTTGEPYNRDPRGMAKKAEAMVKSMGVGDTVVFGPEAEFFVFDDVRFQTTPYNTGFKLDSSELPINSDTEYEGGNLGHRIRTKAGYFPVPPQDSVQDMRYEMLGAMAKKGVKVEKHHHEVASAQHELGMKFDTLTLMADQMQIYKYCIHQVAHIYGKTATFMPKPVYGEHGFRATRAGACIATSRSGRTASRSSPATNTPTCRKPASITSAASSSMPRRSTPSPTRRPTPTSVWFPVLHPRCCSPTPRATVRPPAASPTRQTRRPSASKCVSPTRWPIRISPSPRC